MTFSSAFGQMFNFNSPFCLLDPDSWDFPPGSICWPYAYMDNGLLGQPAEDPIQQPATLQTHTSTSSEPVNLKTAPLRVPSTDMSIFELTSDLTPEKLVAFSQQQEYHRAQQEVKQIFAEHSAANDQPLHSPESVYTFFFFCFLCVLNNPLFNPLFNPLTSTVKSAIIEIKKNK